MRFSFVIRLYCYFIKISYFHLTPLHFNPWPLPRQLRFMYWSLCQCSYLFFDLCAPITPSDWSMLHPPDGPASFGSIFLWRWYDLCQLDHSRMTNNTYPISSVSALIQVYCYHLACLLYHHWHHLHLFLLRGMK